jgi:hypothetical protein
VAAVSAGKADIANYRRYHTLCMDTDIKQANSSAKQTAHKDLNIVFFSL